MIQMRCLVPAVHQLERQEPLIAELYSLLQFIPLAVRKCDRFFVFCQPLRKKGLQERGAVKLLKYVCYQQMWFAPLGKKTYKRRHLVIACNVSTLLLFANCFSHLACQQMLPILTNVTVKWPSRQLLQRITSAASIHCRCSGRKNETSFIFLRSCGRSS